jgi:Ser/Thr protein kinase RdoA (MazF antagonist)
MLDSTLQAVLSFYGLGPVSVRRVEPLENAGGWSGSRLWRIADEAGRELCLRRWPAEHPTVDRLRVIHGVLAVVAPEMPVVACPILREDGSTFVEHGGRLWELTHWKPGRADYHANPSRQRLKVALQALARFHSLAAQYHSGRGHAPTLQERQRRWSGMKDGGLAMIERSLGTPLTEEVDRRAARLLAGAKKALLAPHIPIQVAAVPELWLQPAIRDVHHDHLLFTGDEVTGLIDFGAMRIDTPLADIARLVGSLVGDDAVARDFALNAYSDVRSLSESDRRVIEVLDETGVVLGALNWLTWLYVERRDMGPAGPIVRRMEEILRRMEARAA